MTKQELAQLLISNMTQAEIQEQINFGIELMRRSGLITNPAQEVQMTEQLQLMGGTPLLAIGGD